MRLVIHNNLISFSIKHRDGKYMYQPQYFNFIPILIYNNHIDHIDL